MPGPHLNAGVGGVLKKINAQALILGNTVYCKADGSALTPKTNNIYNTLQNIL